MKKIKFFLFIIIFLASCSTNSNEKTVKSVEILDLPNKTVYLIDEVFDITGGTIKITYNNDSFEVLSMNEAMYKNADTSLTGFKTLDIEFEFKDLNYSLTIPYEVIYTTQTYDITNKINLLPAINKVTLSNVSDVIEIIELMDLLTEEEINYLEINHEALLVKLSRVENYLIPIYYHSLSDEITKFVDFLNPANYSTENIEQINNLKDDFLKIEFNQGLKFLSNERDLFFENINEIEKLTDDPNYLLDDYANDTLELLESLIKLPLYEITNNGLFDSEVNFVEINLTEQNSIKTIYESFKTKIINALSIDEIENIYQSEIENLYSEILNSSIEIYRDNLYNLVSLWKETIEDQLLRYDNTSISLVINQNEVQYENIGLSYYEDDQRWWIPDPYKIPNIIESLNVKLPKYSNLADLHVGYEKYYLELLRAVMQKNIEMYHAIEQYYNPIYDFIGRGLYWNVIAGYNGNSASKSFVYEGVMDEYNGQIYGASDQNAYRLIPQLYQLDIRTSDVLELVTQYNSIINNQLLPKKISSIETSQLPHKSVFRVNENISVEGGKIKITFSNGQNIIIDMKDNMFDQPSTENEVVNAELVLSFNIYNLDLEHKVYYTVSAAGDLISILEKIDNIPQSDQLTSNDLDLVLDILDLYNALTEEAQYNLHNKFPDSFSRFENAQTVLMDIYIRDKLLKVHKNMEMLNIFNYNDENKNMLNNMYIEFTDLIDNLITFEEADNLISLFNEDFSNISAQTLSNENENINILKANTILSIDRLTTINLYKINSNEIDDIFIQLIPINLKENNSIKDDYKSFIASIQNASTIEEIHSIYNNQSQVLYDLVVSEYQSIATKNIQQIIEDFKNTATVLFDGYENNDQVTLDYLTDIWEYQWYTPNQYKVSQIYERVNITDKQTKADVFETYDEYYFEMLRSVMNRTIFTIYQIRVQEESNVSQLFWNTVVSWNAAKGAQIYNYDGPLEEYKNTKIGEESDYRLWGWSYHQTDKVKTINEIVEKYNYDVNQLIK